MVSIILIIEYNKMSLFSLVDTLPKLDVMENQRNNKEIYILPYMSGLLNINEFLAMHSKYHKKKKNMQSNALCNITQTLYHSIIHPSRSVNYRLLVR